MLKIPDILNNDLFLNVPLDYQWEEKTSTFYYVDAHNERLGKTLWKLNHKATLGIATSLSEWVLWRLSKHTERPAINSALAAQWAGIINKRYLIPWKFSGEYKSDIIEGPIWAMLKCVRYPRTNYISGDYFINKKVPNLAMLARHISPDQKFFDDWLSHTLKKAAKHFPAEYDYAEVLANIKNFEDTTYDSSVEPAIPRAFFWDWDYDYDKADNNKFINEFLSSLDYEKSKFLSKPEIMLEEGFEGTPYEYKEQ